MAITFLPEEYTPVGAFSKGMQPYLQMAMQAQFQRRLAEEEMKRKLQMEEQQQPYEIQKALISGGYLRPTTEVPTPKAEAAQQTLYRFPSAQLPAKFKNLVMQEKPDVTVGGMGFKSVEPTEQRLKQAQLKKSEAETKQIEAFMRGGTETLSGFRPKSISIGGVTYEKKPTPEDIEEELNLLKEKEIIQGVSGEVGGRIALAKESIKNIQDVKNILFPTGKSESFKRRIAFGSNLPGGTLPILAQRGWRQEEQDVFRKMGAALSGRQLIQTGVAARPEETAKLVAQFAPSVGSNPQAALNGLNELEEFYKSYLKQTLPEERFKKQPNQIGRFTIEVE